MGAAQEFVFANIVRHFSDEVSIHVLYLNAIVLSVASLGHKDGNSSKKSYVLVAMERHPNQYAAR